MFVLSALKETRLYAKFYPKTRKIFRKVKSLWKNKISLLAFSHPGSCLSKDFFPIFRSISPSPAEMDVDSKHP
jgi:hypothetical protein